MPYGLLNNMVNALKGVDLSKILSPEILKSLDQNPVQPVVPEQMAQQPAAMPVNNPSPMPPENAMLPEQQQPAAQPAPQPSGNGFMDFIGSPTGKGLLYGAGQGLLAKMMDRRNPIVPTALAAAEQFKKQEAMKDMASKFQNANLTPEQKSFVMAAFQSGDPKMIETAAGFLKDEKPVSVGAQGTLVDPKTGRVIYHNPNADVRQGLSADRLTMQKWTSQPVDWRANWLGYTNALGIDQNKAVDAFLAGKTLKQLGREQGLSAEDLRHLNPGQPPTKSVLTTIQTSIGAGKASDVLNKFVSNAGAKYSSNIKGWSGQLISDAASNDPSKIEDVAQFLASKRLKIEDAAESFKRLGGSVSESAIANMTSKDPLGGLKIPGFVLKPEHIRRSNEIIRQISEQAGKAYREAVFNSGSPLTGGQEKTGFVEGKEYKDAQGNKAIFRNGQWEPS